MRRAGEPDRRRSPRRVPASLSWLASARVRPGHEVAVVNLSSGGVLVEAGVRLLPGTRVMLQFVGPGVSLLASAEVVRCQVAALDRERGIRYRGALAFDRELDLFTEEPLAGGYPFPEGVGEPSATRGHDLP